MWHPIHRRSSDQLHNNNLVSIYRRIRLVFPAKFTQSPGQNLKAKFTNFFTKYQKLYPLHLRTSIASSEMKGFNKSVSSSCRDQTAQFILPAQFRTDRAVQYKLS
jgi:hypothetical protein